MIVYQYQTDCMAAQGFHKDFPWCYQRTGCSSPGQYLISQKMNQAQLQILDMLSFIKTPEALRDLNKVISDYFVQMADAELDRMWNEGTLNEERIESFRHLHERTPYNKPIL